MKKFVWRIKLKTGFSRRGRPLLEIDVFILERAWDKCLKAAMLK
jgi:hypothetical protein